MPLLLEKKKSELSNAKHFAQWKSTLETYAYPEIGNLPVDQITMSHIEKCLKPIWNTTTETASRLRGRIERVLDLAISKKFMKGPNPAAWKGNLEFILPKPSTVQNKEHQPAVQLKQAQEWWKELKERDGKGAKALMLLTLTAARSGEIRGMRWAEISKDVPKEAAENGCVAIWTIPATRMKARKEHKIPLTEPMMKIVLSMPKTCEFVFTFSKESMLSDMTLSKLMKRMDVSSEEGYRDATSGKVAVPHGLRSTFRDWVAENGKSRDAAELQLAHRIGGAVEHSYYRSNLIESRTILMLEWYNFLTR